METGRFDDLVRTLSSAPTRRGLLAELMVGLLAAIPISLGTEMTEAKKKKNEEKEEAAAVPTARTRTESGAPTVTAAVTTATATATTADLRPIPGDLRPRL